MVDGGDTVNSLYRIHYELADGTTGHLDDEYPTHNAAAKAAARLTRASNGRDIYWPLEVVQGTYHDSDNWGKYPAAVRKW